MSEFAPSLFAIFKQARLPEKTNPKRRHEQKERVAVAILAATLNHEPEFRDAFIRETCEYTPVAGTQWQLYLEISGCGDLGLVSTDTILVFELKVDAPLQANQKPDAVGGYRDNIDKRYSKVKMRKYVVIETVSSFESSSRGLAKTWHSVLKAASGSKNPWVQDLRQSLHQLGITAFSYGRTANMKLTPHAQTAAQLFALLENVATGRFGFKNTRWDISDEDSYIGKAIFASSDNSRAQGIIGKTKGEIAWFGYEGMQLSVWFYSISKNMKKVRKAMESKRPGQIIEEDANVGIRVDPNGEVSDQLFFEEILSIIFTSK